MAAKDDRLLVVGDPIRREFGDLCFWGGCARCAFAEMWLCADGCRGTRCVTRVVAPSCVYRGAKAAE